MLGNSTVLISGAHGFLGSHLREVLRAHSPATKVLGLARRCQEGTDHCRVIDFGNAESLTEALEALKPDFLFHCAGRVAPNDWRTLFGANVETTTSLLEAVARVGRPVRIVLPGSAAEIGLIEEADLPIWEAQPLRPSSPYGVSKVWQGTAGKFFVERGLDIVTGRLFNLIGKGISEDLSVGSFRKQILSFQCEAPPHRLLTGNLTSERDFLDIEDACIALMTLAARGRSADLYNICSGVPVRMSQLLDWMIEAAGVEVHVVVDEVRLRARDTPCIYGANDKIGRELGWHPTTSLRESVERFMH